MRSEFELSLKGPPPGEDLKLLEDEQRATRELEGSPAPPAEIRTWGQRRVKNSHHHTPLRFETARITGFRDVKSSRTFR
jgi:hypothetical protein